MALLEPPLSLSFTTKIILCSNTLAHITRITGKLNFVFVNQIEGNITLSVDQELFVEFFQLTTIPVYISTLLVDRNICVTLSTLVNNLIPCKLAIPFSKKLCIDFVLREWWYIFRLLWLWLILGSFVRLLSIVSMLILLQIILLQLPRLTIELSDVTEIELLVAFDKLVNFVGKLNNFIELFVLGFLV